MSTKSLGVLVSNNGVDTITRIPALVSFFVICCTCVINSFYPALTTAICGSISGDIADTRLKTCNLRDGRRSGK